MQHRGNAGMPAQRVRGFGSSIIREMTRLSLTYDALNLSQRLVTVDLGDIITLFARKPLAGVAPSTNGHHPL